MASYDERYADYDRGDDDDELYPPPKWVQILKKCVKIGFSLICIFSVGLLLGRMALMGYYPAFAKQLYTTDAIRAYYQTNGTLNPLTQISVVKYEDRTTGFFFLDNIIVIKETGSLQCSLRVNRRAVEDIATHHGVEAPDDIIQFLSFSAYYSDEKDIHLSYTPTHVEQKTQYLYHYYKICFDGVNLEDNIPWYRLNIHIQGKADTEAEPAACIALYQSHSEYAPLTPYKMSKEEWPK